MDEAAGECEKECSYLTDRASAGPHATEADVLKVPVNDVKVSHIRSFRYPALLARYELVTPYLQRILKVAIGKYGKPAHSSSRNPDDVRIMDIFASCATEIIFTETLLCNRGVLLSRR